MKLRNNLPVLFTLTIVVTSCAPRIVGNWNVDRYETLNVGEQGVALTNIGSLNFKRDGTGEKNLKYNIFGTQIDDSTPFIYTWGDDQFVAIESNNSDLSKSWIIMENKSKHQKWKSTDGGNNVQILELTKKRKSDK